MAKRTSKSKDSSPSFEESLEQLQEIVVELEEGSGGLVQSMERFEHGIGLLRTCYQTLERAEQRIELLTAVDEEGRLTTEAFDATATVERKRKPPRSKKTTEPEQQTESDDDEQSLF
jgi:exodeoxyribonuclease VII small subunit